MELHINPKNTIAFLKEEVSRYYPHLKLEFFRKDHEIGEGTPESAMVDDNTTIAELQEKPQMGAMSIDGSMKVAELEELFDKNFGLHVQVYRQSGKLWLQSTLTDEWTLAESESHAAEMTDND